MLAGVIVAMPMAASALPGFDSVRDGWRAADWTLLARDGTPLQRTRVDFTARRGDWVTLADVSPALRQAIVVSEDRRFYAHSGVDWQGAAGAAWGNLWNTRTRGASTLTMQLAGLLDDGPRRTGRRTWSDKATQAWQALELERHWRKDQILEAYLNLVPFRGEIVGLDALSHTLFDKAPSGLDARESAIAAALIRAPNAAPAKVRDRACGILTAMTGATDCSVFDGDPALVVARRAGSAATQTGMAPASGDVLYGRRDRSTADNPDLAPHLARRIAAEVHPVAGMQVRSTLDAPLQRFASDALQRAVIELNTPGQSRHMHDGAVVVLDNATGEIRSWVGASGALSSARDVDAVVALRQAGSTLKPFLYAQAIDERRLNAASLLDDSPLDLQAGGGLYIPQNYDKHFKGWVSVRSALGASLNVPAVRTLVLVTPHRFAKTLKRLGLPLTQEGDYYGYSLALGSADVSLLTLTNAYRTLANGGRVGAPVDLPSAEGTGMGTGTGTGTRAASRTGTGAHAAAPREADRPFSPAAAYVVTTILADNNARVRTFGLDSALNTRGFAAVKTGTSKDMRDNWAVGYTSRYTVGVWVGNADGSPMWNVSGVTGAAPVWAAIVGYLERRSPSAFPAPPSGVESRRITYSPAIEPPRQEWFVRGTGVDTVQLTAQALAASGGATPSATASGRASRSATVGPLSIAAPENGTIFALDPDIPPLNQRIWFERADTADTRSAWRLDGHVIGTGPRIAWSPWPGQHRMVLVDPRGREADAIDFEVRGAFATVSSPLSAAPESSPRSQAPGGPRRPQAPRVND